MTPQTKDRVTLNDKVAYAFVGKSGTVTAQKPDSLNPSRVLYVVQLDNPTPPAAHWTPVESLAVSAECLA